MNKNTTQVPNLLFDKLMAEISPSETLALLVIIRQTNGWINERTGKRKLTDRITQGQFSKKTGLSRKTISQALQKLVWRRYIRITDSKGTSLSDSVLQKGRAYMYFQVTIMKSLRAYACLDVRELLKAA